MSIKSVNSRKRTLLFATAAVGILLSCSVTNGAVRHLDESELAKIIGGCKCCYERIPNAVCCSCGEWGPPPPAICEDFPGEMGCWWCVDPGLKCAEEKIEGPYVDDVCLSSVPPDECSTTTGYCCKFKVHRCKQHYFPTACGCTYSGETRTGGTRTVCTLGSDRCDL